MKTNLEHRCSTISVKTKRKDIVASSVCRPQNGSVLLKTMFAYGHIKRLINTDMQNNQRLRGWDAEQPTANTPNPPTPPPYHCPKPILWLCHSVTSTFCSHCQAATGLKTVYGEGRVCVSDALVFRLLSPCFISDRLSPSSRPRPSPSLHIIQWPETRGPKTPSPSPPSS